jgi:hypothetical protein
MIEAGREIVRIKDSRGNEVSTGEGRSVISSAVRITAEF